LLKQLAEEALRLLAQVKIPRERKQRTLENDLHGDHAPLACAVAVTPLGRRRIERPADFR
jgi:hypothetical protein